MSRIAQILAGVTVAAAASATLQCSGADGTNCSSCVGTGLAQVCASVQVPPPPNCGITCAAGLPGSTPVACSAATSGTQQCYVCVPLFGGALGVGTCVTTTANVAAYLTANSTLNAGLFAKLDLTQFGTLALVSANVTAQSTVDVNSGNNVVILASANPLVSVNVNSASSSQNIFQVNSSLSVGAWNNAGTVQVNNNNAVALQIGQLSLGGSASGGASASSNFLVTQQAGASTTFSSIDFGSSTSGNLQVAGGVAHFGGSASASSNITGSGSIQLSNGVSVDGSIPASVQVSVDVSGSNAPLASIEASTTFSVSGNVEATRNGGVTASTGAVIAVNGNFVVTGTAQSVKPKVILNAGAAFVINTTNTFRAEAAEIGAMASLVIGASVNRATVTVGQIAKCAGTVRINLAVTADAFIAASAAGTSAGATSKVGFSYSSTNNVQELARCGVEVYDANNRRYVLTSTTSAGASAGRRLLASDGSATWGNDQMTFEMQKQSSSAPAVSFAVIPLLVVSMAGLLF